MTVQITTRPDLWVHRRGVKFFESAEAPEAPPTCPLQPVSPQSGNATVKITIDPLRLTRFHGNRQPAASLTGSVLEIRLPAEDVQTADLENVVLVHAWKNAKGKQRRNPVPWSRSPMMGSNVVTFRAPLPQSPQGGIDLELVDARDPAKPVSRRASKAPVHSPVSASTSTDVWILIDGENIANGAPLSWWKQYESLVEKVWLAGITPPQSPKLDQFSSAYCSTAPNPIKSWTVAAADNRNHPEFKLVRQRPHFTQVVNKKGPDHCDLVLDEIHEQLLVAANTTSLASPTDDDTPPPRLLLLTGDGAPRPGPRMNCFVRIADRHVQAGGTVEVVPFDRRNGSSSAMWNRGVPWARLRRMGPSNQDLTCPTPAGWQQTRAQLGLGVDLLQLLFPAPGPWTPRQVVTFHQQLGQWSWNGLMNGVKKCLLNYGLAPHPAALSELRHQLDPHETWPKWNGIHPVIAAVPCMP